MVSLWGSKGNEADGEDSGESVSHHAEADEQTRLLPPPSGRNGYLSPDDPAVRSAISPRVRPKLIY